MASTSPATGLYNGCCHCGRNRFTVRAPTITQVTSCSCTLCMKQGYLWLVPASGAFEEIRADEGKQTEYASSVLRHTFCSECGTGVTGEHLAGPMKGQMAVSLRAMREVDVFALLDAVKPVNVEEVRHRDNPVPADGSVKHVGSCHCGKVTMELLRSLNEQEIKEDNCSGCVRNAWMGIYPTKDLVRLAGQEYTHEYKWGKGWTGWPFCATCGVNVYSTVYGPPQSVLDAVPPERKERAMALFAANMNMQPVNVRAVDGVDLGSLEVMRDSVGTEGYEPLA